MKKIIYTIFSVLCALMSPSFISTNIGDEPTKTYTYYGVVQKFEGSEGLYLNIPEFGLCELPIYEDGITPNLAFEEDDLVSIVFSSEIQVTKSYPAIISTPLKNIQICNSKS